MINTQPPTTPMMQHKDYLPKYVSHSPYFHRYMNRLFLFVVLVVALSCRAQKLPSKDKILAPLHITNEYFMNKWPDAGKSIITNRERPSNIWTRGVYYEGLMALQAIDPQKKYYDYAVQWGEKHN